MTTKEQNNTLNFYQIHSTTSLRKGMETRTTAWRICLLILGLKGLLKVMWIKLVKPSGGIYINSLSRTPLWPTLLLILKTGEHVHPLELKNMFGRWVSINTAFIHCSNHVLNIEKSKTLHFKNSHFQIIILSTQMIKHCTYSFPCA